jgi:RNA polymerase sigma-70 factor (ECF subfamily)
MRQELLTELLEALSAGDTCAAAEVFVAYAPYLRKVIRRQLPARMRAKLDSVDVLQSAWGDILEGLKNNGWHFSSPEQLRAFLVRVMRNRCIDRYRQFRRPLASERPLGEVDPEGLPASPRPGPGEVAQAEELWQRLLGLCPAEHHELLRLKREGATSAEIAARTGLHEGSVRRILRQLAARLACGARMKDEG